MAQILRYVEMAQIFNVNLLIMYDMTPKKHIHLVSSGPEKSLHPAVPLYHCQRFTADPKFRLLHRLDSFPTRYKRAVSLELRPSCLQTHNFSVCIVCPRGNWDDPSQAND